MCTRTTMSDHFGLKCELKNLEIRSVSGEKILEPLVLQLSILVNTKGPSKKKRAKFKHALAAVETSVEIFIEEGERAYTNPDIQQELLVAVYEVRKTGIQMIRSTREFSRDHCISLTRSDMVHVARNFLSAVTRVLNLIDMADAQFLLKALHVVENDLEKVKMSSGNDELLNNIETLRHNTNELIDKASKRQDELKDPQLRDDLAATCEVLKKHSAMLLTASKVYVRHPELSAAKANKDYVLKQVCEAVNKINDIAQGRAPPAARPYDGPGELAASLDDFDNHIVIEPLAYNEVHTRSSLEERLQSIVSRAALVADSSCTRDERRERIIAECNAVRQALQELLTQYKFNMGNEENTESLYKAIDNMKGKTRDLRRQLRKAVVDHISFMRTSLPLLMQRNAALNGDEKQVEEYAAAFTEHSNKLVVVANLVSSMSSCEDGVKLVRYAGAQIDFLCPEVINAARILAARPRSKVAQENLEAFRDTWEAQVFLLAEKIDEVTTVEDFLTVSENLILEYVNKCVLAIQENEAETLDCTAVGIRACIDRIGVAVADEMDNFEPCFYTKRVLRAVKVLNDQVMPKFTQKLQVAVQVILSCQQGQPSKELVENEFNDASRLVYDGVREIRRAVFMNRVDFDPEDVEFDKNYSLITKSKSSAHTSQHGVDEYPEISGITTAREAMGKMPEEDKQEILEHVEYFRSEKLKFDREVAKWDDTGNDIISLAKHMWIIMMEIMDFTRGSGPLKTTMDVINAAKKISEAGVKLDKLTRQIVEQCSDVTTKMDLLAYLKFINLYCHLMNITSKVKADVKNSGGELIVSGLDSALSLIQAAKNLMNAVVLIVKASYGAPTKSSPKKTVSISIEAIKKMNSTKRKPLVKRKKPEEVRAKVSTGLQNKIQEPIHPLSDIQSSTESE